MVIGACPSALAPHEVVFSSTLQHEGAFYVSLGSNFLESLSVLERDDALQVVTEPDHVAMTPSAVVHVIGAIVILEHELVDGLSPVDDLIDQGMAQGILERSCRIVGSGDTYATLAFLVHVISSEVEVICTIFLYDRRSPECPAKPGNILLRKDSFMLRPMDQVLRREGIHEKLFIIGL